MFAVFEKLAALAGNRGHRSMRIQSLLFDKGYFTVRQAKTWARDHGHKYGKVDDSGQYIRLRQLDPDQFKTLRTITLTTGVRAVVAR